MASVTLTGLKKVYPGGVTAVHGADVAIADGEFIVLVGPSGCGKSTILRMIAGLEEVSGGTVEIGGRVVNKLEPGARDIAMVFQNYALYPHMSVRGNMAYGLKNQGLPRAEIDTRIAAAAETLQISAYLDRKPRQLSGGQRQRVAMGRAIVREPAVFLFDEPLSNLDAKLRTQLRAELKDLHARLGATFIFVTHDQVEAMSLADRIVIMSAGKIEQIGTPMALYEHPDSRFVAEFIGAPPMNLFGVDTPIGQALARLANLPGQAVDAGIRPEALHAAEGGPITARIRLIEALGADCIVHLEAEGTRFVWRRAKAAGLTEGQVVTLSTDADAIAGFDADGRAIQRKSSQPHLSVVE